MSTGRLQMPPATPLLKKQSLNEGELARVYAWPARNTNYKTELVGARKMEERERIYTKKPEIVTRSQINRGQFSNGTLITCHHILV